MAGCDAAARIFHLRIKGVLDNEHWSCKHQNTGYYRRAVSSGHCGCSSGVERNLAKVEVVSSNLITRSSFSRG
jgi:hypothetical protein